MTAPKPIDVALLVALAFLGGSSVASADETTKDAAATPVPAAQPEPSTPGSLKYPLKSQREALKRQRQDLLDRRTGSYWRQPPWVRARQSWIEQRSALMREGMRQRQSAMEQWRDAMGWWRNPHGQWIEDMADARRNAIEARRLQAEDWYNRALAQPWGAGPWGGVYPRW